MGVGPRLRLVLWWATLCEGGSGCTAESNIFSAPMLLTSEGLGGHTGSHQGDDTVLLASTNLPRLSRIEIKFAEEDGG